MRRLVASTVLVLASLAIAAPKGKNLGEAEGWKESETLLKRNDASAEKACGTKLTLGYDDKSFAKLSLDEAKPADTYCRDAYNALWGSVCRSEEGKAAVAEKITSVSCRHSADGTKLSLEGKTLIIHVDPKKKELDGSIPGGTHWSAAIKKLL